MLGVPLRNDGQVAYVGGFYAQWEYRVTDLTHVSPAFLIWILRNEVGEGGSGRGLLYGRDEFLRDLRQELQGLDCLALQVEEARLDLGSAGVRLLDAHHPCGDERLFLDVFQHAEALEIFRSRHHQINLVVLDLTMPRMSGHDVAQRLFEIHPGVRVLLASGYSSEHLPGPDNGRILGFIGKPFRPDDLARQVRAALDKPLPTKGRGSHPRLVRNGLSH